MSGLLLAWRAENAEEWGAKLSFSARSRALPLKWAPWHGVMIRIEAGNRWEPACDPESGLSVAVIGRLAWGADLWREAATLSNPGGSAASLLLERWKRGHSQFLELLNGIAIVLVYEAREQKLHLFTDRLGVFPLFMSGGERPVVCSHPDVLADWRYAQGLTVTLDEDTLAESLATGSALAPHTSYKEIDCLLPAAHYIFLAREGLVRTDVSAYWQARSEPSENRHVDYWINRTADAISEAVKKRTHAEAGKVGVFLSGGGDSRAMLYAAESVSALTTITFADAKNPESDVAEQIAHLSGTQHHLMLRDSEHYGETAREGVRISGGNWSIQDNHYHGLLSRLEALSLDSIMTGDYADLLLKGLSLDRKEIHIGRHYLGADRLTPFRYQFYQPHFSVAKEWQQRVDQRYEARFPLPVRANRHLIEDLRARPLGRNSDSMGDSWLLRMQPWDPPFTDNAIIDLYDEMPSVLKLNNRVYGQAVNRLATPAQRRIPHNNHGCAVDASITTIVASALMRRLWKRISGQKKESKSIVTNGSWPNFAYYIAHSPVVAELWGNPSASARELFTQILGEDPWMKPLSWWGSGDHHSEQLFLRLLTSKLWFDLRRL